MEYNKIYVNKITILPRKITRLKLIKNI